jgi:hypothetical protein
MAIMAKYNEKAIIEIMNIETARNNEISASIWRNE